MSDPAPSPFRRFPWLQLAFCIACLAMTAWTWMRYSYAWEVTPEDFWKKDLVEINGRLVPQTPDGTYDGRYVRLHGIVSDNGTGIAYGWLPRTQAFGEWGYVNIELPGKDSLAQYMDRSGSVYGRLCSGAGVAGWPTVDMNASRFHGASIAGLVVGAMGCLIFGLYLSRWLRERKKSATAQNSKAT